MPRPDSDTDFAVLTAPKEEVKAEKPPLYRVLLHNDDYTTMEFVVHVLQDIFHHDENEAFIIMLQVHHDGIGVAGIYPLEVAEMKIQKVHAQAQQQEYPLMCTLEEQAE